MNGYPMLAAGPRNSLAGSDIPYFHLTDQGYKFPTSPTPQQAESAGRAAQHCLRKVVEWCLSTGGDDFQEVPSLIHHKSLLREGSWLIEHVCGIDDWDVSLTEATELEKLLAQIPYDLSARRLTLIDGMELVIDVKDLEFNADAIARETRDMGAISAVEGDKIISPAAKLIPAIKTFYGQDPDVTVVSR